MAIGNCDRVTSNEVNRNARVVDKYEERVWGSDKHCTICTYVHTTHKCTTLPAEGAYVILELFILYQCLLCNL